MGSRITITQNSGRALGANALIFRESWKGKVQALCFGSCKGPLLPFRQPFRDCIARRLLHPEAQAQLAAGRKGAGLVLRTRRTPPVFWKTGKCSSEGAVSRRKKSPLGGYLKSQPCVPFKGSRA